MNSHLKLLECFEAHLAEYQRDALRRVHGLDTRLMKVALPIKRPAE
jgi:hypothetical protein